MKELIKVFIGIIFLFFGFYIGNFLAKITKEELGAGQFWFKLLIITSLIGALISMILKNDVLFFSFLFIAIVTSRSLKKKKVEKK
ncbi:MAG: hypothetical protein KatS3mg093_421 [Candidatus Parcubacteria bacterium]|nr:MAG: hypothetical protein KatS3mg093_421 [Candidatus Parcubacteria bacterium]